MKKITMFILLIILCIASINAETVLFCISDNKSGDEMSPWTVSVLRAFEDGILNSFFDSGHIVTNSYLNECRKISGKDAETNADVARIMGNRLGADSVMILEVIFPEGSSDNLPVPIAADYALYTNTGKVLTDKTRERFSIAKEIGEEELLDSFTVEGEGIAAALVPMLKTF